MTPAGGGGGGTERSGTVSTPDPELWWGEQFGMGVQLRAKASRGGAINDVWAVLLPHQCDEWVIAEGVDKADVAAQLRAFIAEATEALAALEAAEVCEHEWVTVGPPTTRDERLVCSRCHQFVWPRR